MRSFIAAAAVSLVTGCTEPTPTANHVSVVIDGERHDWRTNDGVCQLRNMSSSLTCTVGGDLSAEEDDFSLSLNVGVAQVIEERTYTDVPEAAFPDLTARLWFPGEGGARRWETSDTVGQPLVLSLDHLGQTDVEATFDLHLASEGADPVQVTGALEMELSD